MDDLANPSYFLAGKKRIIDQWTKYSVIYRKAESNSTGEPNIYTGDNPQYSGGAHSQTLFFPYPDS